MKRSALLTALALLVPCLCRAQDTPAGPLMPRSYTVAGLPDGRLVAGATYGMVLYDPTVDAADTGEKMARLAATGDTVLLPDSVNRVLVDKDRIYAANGPQGVRIFQVPDDGTVQPLAHVELPGAAMGLFVAEDLLFVAMGVMGIAIFDVADPEAVQEVVTLDTGGYARDVYAQRLPDNALELWVANDRGGLIYMAVDGGCEVTATARLETQGAARRLVPFADGFLVSRGRAGVCYVTRDLSSESLACVSVDDIARGLAVDGTRVFVADGGAGLVAVDWARPASPVVTGRFRPDHGSLNDVRVINGTLYGAADHLGPVRLEPPAPSPSPHQEPSGSGSSDTRR